MGPVHSVPRAGVWLILLVASRAEVRVGVGPEVLVYVGPEVLVCVGPGVRVGRLVLRQPHLHGRLSAGGGQVRGARIFKQSLLKIE